MSARLETMTDLLWTYNRAMEREQELHAELTAQRAAVAAIRRQLREELSLQPAGTIVEAYGRGYRLEGSEIRVCEVKSSHSIKLGEAEEQADADPAPDVIAAAFEPRVHDEDEGVTMVVRGGYKPVPFADDEPAHIDALA